MPQGQSHQLDRRDELIRGSVKSKTGAARGGPKVHCQILELLPKVKVVKESSGISCVKVDLE